MKDNLNIEKLFQEKFSSFEGEVSPNAWANIQQGMGATGAGTATATGMGLLLKTALISGGIVAATFGGIYLFSEPNNEVEEANSQIVQVDLNNKQEVINDKKEEVDEIITENTLLNERAEELVLEGGNKVDEVSNLDVVNHNINTTDGYSLNEGGSDEGSTTSEPDKKDDESIKDSGEVVTHEEESSSDVFVESNIDKVAASLTFESGDDYAPSTYTFHANAENYSQVLWDFENGVTRVGTTVEYTFNKPGTYTVSMTVTGFEGKKVIQTQDVLIQSKSSIDRVPNTFTPNGDRKNDFFVIMMTEIETFVISIRNPEGKVLFQSSDPNFRWYGTNQAGDKVENGTYTYEFFARGYDGNEFPQSGTIRIED